ncbi:MAG: glycosyltransferase [archaeon]
MDALLLAASLAVTVLFFFYGFNLFYLLRLSGRYKTAHLSGVDKPPVSIHLPVFNERYVVERLLASCTRLADHYGKDKVHISVLDDSDDETTTILQNIASGYRSENFNIEVIHRDNRSGFKSGALNEALARTREEFIVVFNSNFLPKADFLDRAVAYIVADDHLGIVQFRWSYTNRDYNWITKSVSIGMDAYFLIEQPGRCAEGLFHNFNGSGGIIRTEALRQAGGWQLDTLAEDLDASYRIQMRNYRILYVLDDVPCEITPTVASFKRQQARWARGSLQVAKKILPDLVLRRDISVKQKFEALIHLTYYLVHPLMYASFLLAAAAAILNVSSIKTLVNLQQINALRQIWIGPAILVDPLWITFAIPILVCNTAVWIYYMVAMHIQGLSVLRNLRHLFALCFLGYGISINNSIEAARAFLLKSTGVFKRTPKYAVTNERESWRDKNYQVPLDWVSMKEAASIILAAFAALRALYFENY